MDKPILSIEKLLETAKAFCEIESTFENKALYGVTDGKAVETLIELKFKELLAASFTANIGNAASGIDLPSGDILTDIKVTSIKQPQSSCPFKDARQKIFGLGYNLLVFVYNKRDDAATQMAVLDFVSCSFIEKERTADYRTTRMIRQLIENEAIEEEIVAYLNDCHLSGGETKLVELARQILKTPPNQGDWILPPALDWRLWNGKVASAGNLYFKPSQQN